MEELRGTSRLFSENWKPDRQLVNELWIENGKFRDTRKTEVSEFKFENILISSQGPRGHWPGGHPKPLEFILNIPWRFRRYRMLFRELFY